MFSVLRASAILSISALVLILIAPSVSGDWDECGIPITTADLRQSSPRICPDGFGGTIISWTSREDGGSHFDIFIQRVDADGNVLWDVNGMPVRVAEGCDRNRGIVPDGTGGAIVVWLKGCLGYDYEIYATRINNLGYISGSVEGYPICDASGEQTGISVVPDGENGAYVVWEDYRSGGAWIYAQRIDNECNSLWQDNGVPISGGIEPSMDSDNSSSLVVTYVRGWNIHAQRIDRDGTPRWGDEGVPVCVDTAMQKRPDIASDGSGGAFICWEDDRDSLGWNDIYVQRVDSFGNVQWDENGVPACVDDETRWHSKIIADSHGGAVIVWSDRTRDVLAQVVSGDGMIRYGLEGYPVSTSNGDQRSPTMCRNKYGDIIIAWSDYRASPSRGYMQLLDRDGVFRWAQDGIPICADAPLTIPFMTADGNGNIIGVSLDESVGDGDLFAGILHSESSTDVFLCHYDVAIAAGSIVIEWAVNSSDPENRFSVFRREVGEETFCEILKPSIAHLEESYFYVDFDIEPGISYQYQVYASGDESRLLFETNALAVPPVALSLDQNYPNPFNPSTTIRFYLPFGTYVRLEIFNLAGRLLRLLTAEHLASGEHEVSWNGIDNHGHQVASGVYYYRLKAGKQSYTRKMVLLK